MNNFNWFILIFLFVAGCQNRVDSNSGNQGKNWERVSTEPSVTLNAFSSNKPVDFNLLIKDNPTEIFVDSEILDGNLQFDKGSLTIINAGLKLSENSGIEFLGTTGNIELNNASLKVSGLINAVVEAGNGSKLHLFGTDPLCNSTINISGTGASLFLFGTSPGSLSSEILSKEMIKVEGVLVEIPEGTNKTEFDGYTMQIQSLENGTLITVSIRETLFL